MMRRPCSVDDSQTADEQQAVPCPGGRRRRKIYEQIVSADRQGEQARSRNRNERADTQHDPRRRNLRDDSDQPQDYRKQGQDGAVQKRIGRTDEIVFDLPAQR
jgi:hypothetical protein